MPSWPTVGAGRAHQSYGNLGLGSIAILSGLFSFGPALMSDDYKIYVDGGRPAT